MTVSINSVTHKTTHVQFEVVSNNDRIATLWKLAAGLNEFAIAPPSK